MDIEAIRFEALRKLGRNVVNFSKIEEALKVVLTISKAGESGKNVSEQLREHQIRLRKLTLGRLVNEFTKDVIGDPSWADAPIVSSTGRATFSFRVIFDPAFSKARKRELLKLVTERNRLIHQELAYLDTTSMDDYRRLIDLLDEQNPRLLQQLEELEWILESVRKSMEDLQALVKSPDFLERLKANSADT